MCEIVNGLGKEIGVKLACCALDVPRSWYYRRQIEPQKPKEVVESQPTRPEVKAKLSDGERKATTKLLHSARFVDKSPRQVYATLLDEGIYHCHWRTMYRILAAEGEVVERRRQRKHPQFKQPQLVATQINQVWSWDITWLPGPIKGQFYYLYVILDLYSRYIVGWLVAESESGELAEKLIDKTCARQGITNNQLTLHADRGAPMRSKVVTALLQDLGVAKSHSRPRTSNDNPYSEAQFKTMKYCPDYPGQFETIDTAREWVRTFIKWYNQDHYHTGISLLTPQMVHQGRSQAVCAQRQQVLDIAYQAHPERFKQGRPQAKMEPNEVWINRPNPVILEPSLSPVLDQKDVSVEIMTARHEPAECGLNRA